MTKYFVTITNREIYNQIIKIAEDNETQHNEIIKRLDITNGKVKLNKWIATTALTLIITVIFFLVNNGGK